MFEKVRQIAKDFIESDMQGESIMKVLKAILDNKDDYELKTSQLIEDANQAIREKKIWKLAFKLNATTCNNQSCVILRKWISRRGYSERATSMD
jgi:uncharacterized protein YxjI